MYIYVYRCIYIYVFNVCKYINIYIYICNICIYLMVHGSENL